MEPVKIYVRILINAVIFLILPLLWLGGCAWRDFRTSDEVSVPEVLQSSAVPVLTDLRQELIEYLQRKGITFVSRKDWGAKDSKVRNESITRIEGIVIHHSASTNTAKDWAEQVRIIQQNHINRGWGDIGYNFLIDPNGKIYEGRTTSSGFAIGVSEGGQLFAVIGSHTAAESLNARAIGINFIGCYMSELEGAKTNERGSPTSEALYAAKVLIEWLAEKIGKASCFIIAHRDVEPGKPHCPGWNVYVKLPEFRESAGTNTALSLSETVLYFSAKGGEATITVTSSHWWQVYSGAPWIEIKQPQNYRFKSSYGTIRAIGYENGSVLIVVKPNRSSEKRIGYVVIGGVLVTVEQDEGKVATPKFDPSPGRFQGMQWVNISCSTPGAVIHYTTDGTQPTEKSPRYTGPLLITSTTTLKARAFKSGLAPSNTATATYVIQIPSFLTQFWIFVHYTQVKKGWNWVELPVEAGNRRVSIKAGKYVRIEEIEQNKRWRIGFEDATEEANEYPDWDYDEPLLEIELLNPNTRELRVRGIRITGIYLHDLWFRNQLIYKSQGGGDIYDFGEWKVRY